MCFQLAFAYVEARACNTAKMNRIYNCNASVIYIFFLFRWISLELVGTLWVITD